MVIAATRWCNGKILTYVQGRAGRKTGVPLEVNGDVHPRQMAVQDKIRLIGTDKMRNPALNAGFFYAV